MKKNKSITITLIVLIIFATMFLYIGSSVILEIDHFLDDKNKSLNGSDFSVLTPKIHEEDVKRIITEIGDYAELEQEEVILKFSSDFQNVTLKDKSQSIGSVILNAENEALISKLKIIDEGEQRVKNSIVLPHFLKLSKGYRTGDEITITYGGKTISFIIYGFAEDIMFAVPNNLPFYKCYIYGDMFKELLNEENVTTRAVIYKSRLNKGVDPTDYEFKFVKKTNDILGETLVMSLDIITMKVGVSIFLIIMMAIFIVFSIIIILIVLTMMRFAIVTHIEGNIKNIGSMEALGYTTRQLILATVLQFILITFVGSTIGYILAFSFAGMVTNIVSSSIGLGWDSKINPLGIFISLFVIFTSTSFIAYSAAAKMKKITPIVALRSGVETHNFKKNRVPLVKSNLNVHIALGIKMLLQNMKQNITILIIVILMAFVCVFAFTINYNFNVDNTAFLRLIGMEKSHLSVVSLEKDSKQLFSEISQMAHVIKSIRITDINLPLIYGEKELTPGFSICNDFSQVETNTIIKGRYPIHDNEISMTGIVLNQLGAQLGDVVSVKGKSSTQDFIIVGISQHIRQLGKSASITEEGMLRMNENFIPSQMFLYLDSSDNIPIVMATLEEKHGAIVQVSNVEEIFDTLFATFNNAVNMLCITGIFITIIIITLTLYLLIKIKLLKERTRIGISKAVGYTTKQLILQIIIGFCPVCILGAFLGTVLAIYLINPTFALMLSVSGILNSNLIINPIVVIVTFLSLTVMSVIITAVIALRIRKITPCELFV